MKRPELKFEKAILGWLFLFLCLSMPVAHGETETPRRVQEGSSQLGGMLGLGSSTVAGTIFQLDFSYQYFIADRWAVGGLAGFRGSSWGSQYEIGPQTTWYFFAEEDRSFYAGAALLYDWYTAPKSVDFFESRFRIGMDYFLSKNVALSPYLQFAQPLKSVEEDYRPTAVMLQVSLVFYGL